MGGKVSPGVAKAIVLNVYWVRIQSGVPGRGTNILDYVGVPSTEYVIQFATNLTTRPWFTPVTNTVAADGRETVIDCTATNSQRLYRVRTP